jgi:hypothetical protein
MVTENDIRAKADEEILSMWAAQHDYIPEVVELVKVEIDRRQLDTSVIHVRTMDEIEEEMKIESDRNFIRMFSFLQGAGGIFLLVIGISDIQEQLNEIEPELVGPLIMLLVGLLLIIYAISVWKEKKWAIISGLILCLIASISNAVFTIIIGLGFLIGYATLISLVWSIAWTFISICLLLAFNRMRKSKKAGEKPGTAAH